MVRDIKREAELVEKDRPNSISIGECADLKSIPDWIAAQYA